MHITIGAVDQDIQVEDEEDDDDNSDDDDDDNDNDNDDEDVEELYTIESCSEVSSVSHDSIPDLDDLNVALQEFFDSNGTRGMFAIRCVIVSFYIILFDSMGLKILNKLIIVIIYYVLLKFIVLLF